MSATRLKSSFGRQGSLNSYAPPQSHGLLERDGPDDLLPRYNVPSWLAKDLQDVWQLLGSDYINILLVIAPFGLLSGALGWDPVARFTLSFLSIIPLQSLISYASEELALSLGPTLGGLLNAILGSATELIVSIVALKENETRVVQASIMGSIFSNMLLTPGACFFVGGIRWREQSFGGSIMGTMLFPTLASIMTLVAPTVLYSVTAGGLEEQHESNSLSLGCAVVLLLLHAANVIFQLKTHPDLFDVDEIAEDPDSMEPNINPWTAAISLPLTLFLITVCANNLVSSLPPIIDNSGLCRAFIGFVLLPFLGSTAEQFTAVVVAYKNKIVLALGVCNGSIMQTVLFVMPVLVITGAAMDHPLTLYFGRLEIVAVLFATVLLVALMQRGTSTYFDGLLCLGLYSVVVIAFRVLPEEIHPSEQGASAITMQALFQKS